MNKLEIIQALKERADLTRQESADFVEIFFESLTETLVNGDRVEIRGLCLFYVKEYESYTGRNPKTGEQALIPSKKLPFFKCGKELRKRVDV